MRFGSRRHDVDEPQLLGAKLAAERTRLVKMLRDVADRLEQLPDDRASEVVVWVKGAIEPLVALLPRVLPPKR